MFSGGEIPATGCKGMKAEELLNKPQCYDEFLSRIVNAYKSGESLVLITSDCELISLSYEEVALLQWQNLSEKLQGVIKSYLDHKGQIGTTCHARNGGSEDDAVYTGVVTHTLEPMDYEPKNHGGSGIHTPHANDAFGVKMHQALEIMRTIIPSEHIDNHPTPYNNALEESGHTIQNLDDIRKDLSSIEWNIRQHLDASVEALLRDSALAPCIYESLMEAAESQRERMEEGIIKYGP